MIDVQTQAPDLSTRSTVNTRVLPRCRSTFDMYFCPDSTIAGFDHGAGFEHGEDIRRALDSEDRESNTEDLLDLSDVHLRMSTLYIRHFYSQPV